MIRLSKEITIENKQMAKTTASIKALIYAASIGTLFYAWPLLAKNLHSSTAPSGSRQSKVLIERGKALFTANQCLDCHTVGGKGYSEGYPLDGIAKKRTKQFLTEQLADPEKHFAKAVKEFPLGSNLMTTPNLSKDEIAAVIAYLESLPVTKPALPIIIPPAKYKPTAASSESRKGKLQFAQNNCAVCHSIDSKGGCLAPPLDGIGARRDKAFILARITDQPAAIKQFEKLYPYPELLVHPRLSPPQAKSITSYLLTIPDPKGGFRITGHALATTRKSSHNLPTSEPDSKSVVIGKAVFNEHGCIACHSIGSIGGHLAPRLDGISSHRDRQYIADRISAAEFLTQGNQDEYPERGAIMPPSNLTDQQIAQLTSFLMSLPKSR